MSANLSKAIVSLYRSGVFSGCQPIIFILIFFPMTGSVSTGKFPERPLCASLILLSACILLHTVATSEYDISERSEIRPLTDARDGGTSRIQAFVSIPGKTGVNFKFGDGYEYPYAGVEYHLSQKVRLERYDYLLLSMEKMDLKTISVGLFAFNKKDREHITWFETEMPIRKIAQNYGRLPLSEFYTPTWWFYTNDIPLVQTDMDDYPYADVIQIRCRKRAATETEDVLSVTSLKLKRGRFSTVIRLLLAAAAALSGIAVLFAGKIAEAAKKKLKIQQPIPYIQQAVHTDREKWDNVIITCIQKNLGNPDFNRNNACSQCSISTNEMNRLVQKFGNATFSAFIRELRIKRATAMLLSGKKPVTLIAMESGFRSIPGFNSAFKRSTGYSPTEYRRINDET